MSKGTKKGLKNPFWPKNCPHVLIQVSGVPVQVGLYPFLHNLYRYRLDLYWYSCSNFSIFFVFFIYIFLQIENSSADVKSIVIDCLPSWVSLHAHLSFCSYSAQTDCIHEVDNCISFFRHFQSFHGAHFISGDQGS